MSCTGGGECSFPIVPIVCGGNVKSIVVLVEGYESTS